MTNEAVVAVLLRLAGIWMGVSTLVSTMRLIGSFTQSQVHHLVAFGSIQLFWFILSAALVLAPLSVARNLLPKSSWSQGSSRWEIEDLQRVLFATLGLYFLVLGILSTSRLLTSLSLPVSPDGSGVIYVPPALSILVPTGLQMAIGLWLLFGAKGVHGILSKVRRAGPD